MAYGTGVRGLRGHAERHVGFVYHPMYVYSFTRHTSVARLLLAAPSRKDPSTMRKLIVLGVVGLIAQLIDGSLGMAYGVTSSTLLLAAGVAPAAASAAVHFSEIGTSLVSGASHHKLGNVDWRTVSILAVPGFVGAFAGATLLSNMDAAVAKPVVAVILLSLGFYVVYRFLRLRGAPRPDGPHRRHARRRRWRWLGPRRDHVAALQRSPRAPQGRRLDRHLGVRRRGRRLARLPHRPRRRRHQLGLRRRPARRWCDRRPGRRVAGQAPRRPRPRHRCRWP